MMGLLLSLFYVLDINNNLILQWLKRPGWPTDTYHDLTLTISLRKLFWLSDINARKDATSCDGTGCMYKTDTFTGSKITLIQDAYTDDYGYTLVLGI